MILYVPGLIDLRAIALLVVGRASNFILMLNEEFEAELQNLIRKKDYPCLAAIKSVAAGDYEAYSGGRLGKGERSQELAAKLKSFKGRQPESRSIYSTFFCYFDAENFDEATFEQATWKELSLLSAAAGGQAGWDPKFSSDPQDKKFCFSLDGEAFFVVGMHANSSRLARRLSRPVIVFNLYEQFGELDRRGGYLPMVRTKRERDTKFQGNVNSMVERYGGKWEAIQFSERENRDD